MSTMHKIPISELVKDDFFSSIDPHEMVNFLCNVGDADAQLLLLPENKDGERQAIIIDAGIKNKIPWLISDLVPEFLPETPDPNSEDHYPDPDESIPLIIATHPHKDHISGMADLLRDCRNRITEFWDPGYFLPTTQYIDMMTEVGRNKNLLYAQPTSGFRKWIGDVVLTVMSPSIELKNRFDIYGTEINDSSITVRVEYPAARVINRDEKRELINNPTTMSLLLGADTQTLSWSYVYTDFPYLPESKTAVAKAIDAATGGDLLRSDVMKISHHCSKRGVNLELMERIDPRVTLVSSVGGKGSHKFPHEIAQEIIREAKDPIAKLNRDHKKDWELNIYYTSDLDDNDTVLGTIALVMSANKITMWRFGDNSTDRVKFDNARRMT